MTRRSCLWVLVQISQPWYQFRFAHELVLAMFMIWSRILKMTLIQQQSLHVRHALSGSGLEGDLRDVAIETGNSPTR